MRTIIDIYQDEIPQFRKDTGVRGDIRDKLEELMSSKGFESKHSGFRAETGFILDGVFVSPEGTVVITDNINVMGSKIIEGAHVVTTSSDSRLASAISREIKDIYLNAGYTHQMHEDFRNRTY